MELLDEMNFDWQVNTVITKWNSDIVNEIKPLIEYLQKFKKVKSIKFSPMGFPMYKNKDTFVNLRASYDKIVEIEKYINKNTKTSHSIEVIFSQPNCKADYFPAPKMNVFNSRSMCSANQKGFVVLPNGEVTICEELYWNPHFIIGDIKTQSITEIWNSDKAKKLFYVSQSEFSPDSTCKMCDSFVQCRHFKGVCWKMVIMAYGKEKWFYPDPSCPKSPRPNETFYY